MAVAGCGSGPTTSVHGTVALPDGGRAPEAAVLSVHLTGFDDKRQVYVTFRIYKKKNPGSSPFPFVMSRVPVSELKKYFRYHVYAQVDLNGDGKITRGEPTGSTEIEIQNPADPIKDAQVLLRHW
ncbi:MAG: YbaY family lipoprotein [Betaproteobacteria bacterium]|nr:YbaY family lipoprotein [Betaproteobacteria bacterium]